jgi:CO dehydrogenase maturation factor
MMTAQGTLLRLAFVGKGGAGKSSIAGTMARLLGAAGAPVLALDSDPMPGLAYAVGVPRTDAGLPAEAIEPRPDGEEGPRYRLAPGLTAVDAVERYAVTAPDGVRFLQFGKAGGTGGDLFGSQVVFRQLVRDLPEDRWHLIGDLPGGTRQAFFGWGGYARTMLVVVEPTPAGVVSARRLARLRRAEGAPRLLGVVSKARDAADAAHLAERTGLEVIASIPHDESLAEADRLGVAPIDHDPGAAAVTAVRSLLERVLEA